MSYDPPGFGGGGDDQTDFGTSIVPAATTPKELVVINGTIATATATDITFDQADPNAGTWAALYNGTSSRSTFTRHNFNAAFSLSVWLKTTSTDATSGYSGNPACVIFGDHSNSIAFAAGVHDGKWEARRFNGSIWQTVTHPTAVNDGAWKFCALSYDAGALLMYVADVDDDVAELHTGAVSSGQTGGCDTLGAGYLNGSGYADFFPGTLYLPTLYQGMIWTPHPLA